MAKKIAIGADHGGFLLKEKLIKELKRMKYQISDRGTSSKEPCDYPEFGFRVAEEVSRGRASRGIVICKTGIGMSVIANKYPRVRAGLCSSVSDAESSRKHNDTNVLVLAAKKVSAAKALDITKVWLKTKALGGRHARRVKRIESLEKKVFKKI